MSYEMEKRVSYSVVRVLKSLFSEGERGRVFEADPSSLTSDRIEDFALRKDALSAVARMVEQLVEVWSRAYPQLGPLRISPHFQVQAPAEPTFGIANAKVGTEFRAAIEVRGLAAEAVEILDPRLPDGLHFDAETSEIHGRPAAAGEFEIYFFWCLRERPANKSRGVCPLIVNPDPQSLWKEHEPPADAPFPKPNTDARQLEAGEHWAIAASRRGRSHAHHGSFRDDDFFVGRSSEHDFTVILVGDGAGRAKLSRRGSELTVREAGSYLVSRLAGETGERLAAAAASGKPDEEAAAGLRRELTMLFVTAAGMALTAVEAEVASAREDDPAVRSGDFATTLLAALCRPSPGGLFVATFWVGDGAIAAFVPGDDQSLWLLGRPDSGEFAGQTRFLDAKVLAGEDVAQRVSFAWLPAESCLLVMSDGVSDPRFPSEKSLSEPQFWHALWSDLEPAIQAEDPEAALLSWLDFPSPGHHDDRTLALFGPRRPV